MEYKFKKINVEPIFKVNVINSKEEHKIKNFELLNEILEKNKIDVIKESENDFIEKEYFFNKMSFITVLLVICPPAGIALMFAYGKFKIRWKILITIIVIVIDIILLSFLVHYLKQK
ncbi:MAG: hypothetical protein ACRC28_02905 [Clostridium sp.]|uniref:hypothetical protein n=1 Tax=Clostridium sp. TaxID=1506 RepID=UPI003F2E30FD